MNTSATSVSTTSSSPQELFALTDEQILDIAPDATAVEPVGQPSAVTTGEPARAPNHLPPTLPEIAQSSTPSSISHESPLTSHDSAPPPWLAAQLKDPWTGEEAQEFWHGVQQTRSEAAAYRQAIATPEDARALKELYPGGITEARATAERARTLDQIDRAYFGGEGNSPEQRSASRAQLAHQLLREDPAAFREMLAAGLAALQQAEQGSSAAGASSASRLAQALTPNAEGLNVAPPFRVASSTDATPQTNHTAANPDAAPVLRHSPARPVPDGVTNHHSLSAYAAFERAANDDLERSVGATIERALAQALPVAQPLMAEQRNVLASGKTAQTGVPALQPRLSAAIRAEVEKSLQGDRQLAEQVAQILAARRFDSEARAQVVRLINDRAQQLVPGAARRVLNDWTQTTLAAHRSRSQRADASSATRDVPPASPESRSASSPEIDPARSRAVKNTAVMLSAATSAPSRVFGAMNNPSSSAQRRVDYRKLSDEQILNL